MVYIEDKNLYIEFLSIIFKSFKYLTEQIQ